MEWIPIDAANRAMDVLRERGVPTRCPVCDRADFRMMSYYVFLVMTNDPNRVAPEHAAGTPCLGLTCPNCGNLQLHNLQELGMV
jgi:hypothetical protein